MPRRVKPDCTQRMRFFPVNPGLCHASIVFVVNNLGSRTEYAVSTLERCLRKSTIFCRATGRIGRLSGISL